MNKLLSFALAAGTLAGTLASGLAQGQTPTVNPMPDGSRDMYAGLGVQSAPRYEGSGSRKVSALPVLQIEWSNGMFISGMSAGMHLSNKPTVEYGPLLAIHPGRDEDGSGTGADGVYNSFAGPVLGDKTRIAAGRLAGMEEIGARLQFGGFYNTYLTPQWRLTSSLLAGSGRDHNGVRLELGVQRLALAAGERHRVSLSAGLGIVNRQYNETYFGVTVAESMRSGRFPTYQPGGGVQDVHVGARWNWVLSPSWMLTSSLQAKRLLGDASHSPLTERSTNTTVSTAVAYRF